MRRFTILLTIATLLLGAVAVDAVQFKEYGVTRGGKSYVDSLEWNSAGSDSTNLKVDTLIGTAQKDTTTSLIPIANIESMGLWFEHDQRQGTAAGTQSINCSMQVSNNGTDWVPADVVFSHVASSDTTTYINCIVPYYLSGDTTARVSNNVWTARYARFIVTFAGGAADTAINVGILSRRYRD